MKNYKVEAIMKFTDKEENAKRNVGDEFNTTKERYEYLKSKSAVKLLEIIEDYDNEDFGIVQEWENEEQDKTIDEIVDEVIESEEINKVIDKAVDETVEKLFKEKPKKKKHSKK